jgi:adenosyl cobinamide kinase/adenosyl cobinamide phosphate guanylyltransferase
MVLVDDVTLWVANLLDRTDAEVLQATGSAAALLAEHPGGAVVVTNEVGDGIVPDNPMARRYRDLLGRVNREFMARADAALLVVAGRVVRLDPPGSLFDD